MNWIELLSNIEIFQNLDEEQLKLVEKCIEEKKFADGEEIFHENSKESDLYILLEGRVQVKVDLDKTEQATIHTILPGRLFGEFAFIDDQPRSATAHVIKNCTVLKIQKEKLIKLFEENNAIGYKVMYNLSRVFARRIRQTAHELKVSLMWEKS